MLCRLQNELRDAKQVAATEVAQHQGINRKLEQVCLVPVALSRLIQSVLTRCAALPMLSGTRIG